MIVAIKSLLRDTEAKLLQRCEHLLGVSLLLVIANLRHTFFGRVKGKFGFDQGSSLFYYEGDCYKRYFPVLFRHVLLYSRGAKQRGDALGREYMLNSICFREADVVIDVGANIGDLELYFRNLNIPVQYSAYEPAPKEFKALSMNRERHQSVYNLGCWSESGKMAFFVASDTADSSLIDSGGGGEAIEIEVARLDSMQSVNGKRIRLLKVEAEGGEPEVLLGSENLLKYVDYVVVDAGFERGRHRDSTLVEVVNYMLARGFFIKEINYSRLTVLFASKAMRLLSCVHDD